MMTEQQKIEAFCDAASEVMSQLRPLDLTKPVADKIHRAYRRILAERHGYYLDLAPIYIGE